jgi:hypothetical protein
MCMYICFTLLITQKGGKVGINTYLGYKQVNGQYFDTSTYLPAIY